MIEKFLFNHRQQLHFLEDLHALIKDGVSALVAAETIRDTSNNLHKKIANNICLAISEGRPLVEGLSPWFSHHIIEIIRNGESGGTLLLTIESAIATLQQQNHTIHNLFQALTYPCLVLTLALIVTVFVRHSVLNTFITMRPINEWPQAGRSLYDLGGFVEHWWLLLLMLFFFFIYLLHNVLQNASGKWRELIDTLPLISLYRDVIASRFMQTLGLLVSNGIILKKALYIMQIDASPYLASHLVQMEYRLSSGVDNMADVLNTNLIREDDMARLMAVSKGRGFAPALISLGDHAFKRTNLTIQVSSKIIGALILVLSAFIAGMVVIGIYSVGGALAAF